MRGVARPGSIRETGAGNKRSQNPRTAKEFVTWRARGDGFNLAAQATQTATSAPLQVRGSRGQDDGSGVLDQSNLGRTVSQQRDRKGRFAGKAKPRYPRTHMQTRMTGDDKPRRPPSEIGTARKPVSRFRRPRRPMISIE
jgi:hypothetical protein